MVGMTTGADTRTLIRALVVLTLTVCLGWPAGLIAGPLTGRLSAEFYTYERGDSAHVRPYLRLVANWNALRASRGRSISFHTSLRWMTDFADQLPADPQTYVHNMYVRVAGYPRGLKLDIGRQFAYVGIGSAHLDGARLRYDYRWITLDVYGGSWVSRLDPSQIRSIEDFGTWGGQLLLRAGSRIRLGAHLIGNRDRGDLSRHQLGASAEFRSRWWTMYALYAYDLVDGASSSLLTRLIYHRGAWTARGDYSRREPTVAVNSLFSLINSIAYDELRLSVQRRVFGMTSLLVGVHGTLFDRGSAWRGRLGLTSPHYAVIGLLQSGDRGDLLGIQGYLTPFPNRRWQPFARFTLNRYAIQEEQDGRSDAYVIAAGTFWRAPANRFLRLEVQWLRNAVETGTLRLYLQFTQGFSWNPVKGGATP